MINVPMILDEYLFSADTATNDEIYRLRLIVTVEIAQELYELHKKNLDNLEGWEVSNE